MTHPLARLTRSAIASVTIGGLAAAVLVAAALPAPEAAAVPSGFADQVLWSGLTVPTEVAFAPDGQIFVTEKSGRIQRFDSLADTTPTQIVDLSTQVFNYADRGLLGLAVDPDFGPARPFIYVQYAYDHILGSAAPAPRWGTPGQEFDDCPNPPGADRDGCVVSARVSKLVLSSAVGGTVASEQVLVEDWCQQMSSHSIGTIAFGADKKLYAGGGDGASFNVVDYGQLGGSAGSPVQVNPCGDPPTAAGTAPVPATARGGALRSQAAGIGARESITGMVTLSGTVIRIDPDTGLGVAGNPWFARAGADANEKRVIAYGFRNPFRFSLRGGTNELWLGDVGWGAVEEINVIPDATTMTAPLNYGWPCYEGNARQGGYDGANLGVCETLYTQGAAAVRGPYASYTHAGQPAAGDGCPTGSSSIAGVAYYNRPSGAGTTPYPARYDGSVFFTDYNRRCIWVMLPGTDGRPDPAQVEFFHKPTGGIVDLVVGPGGDLFYPNIDQGQIHRIRYFPANTPPVASFSATPASGTAPLAVTFDASASTDAEGDALSYAWDLDGDTQFDDATGVSASRTYPAGTTTVGLRVTDARGASTDTTRVVSSGNSGPTATITSPTATQTWKVNDAITFSGGGTDAEDGAVPASRLSWLVSLLTCNAAGEDCVTRRSDPFTGASGTLAAPDWSGEGNNLLEFRLTATDSGGLTSVSTVRLRPQTVTMRYETSPPGLQLSVAAETRVTPFSRTVVVGSQNSLGAPTPQTSGGGSYAFASWSDGGAATHVVAAPATATTYTATYTASAAPSGLVAAYGFEETAGTAATDSSGSSNAGTLSASTTRDAAGRFGRALSFNGTSSSVRVPDAASLDLGTAMTLEAWVRPTAATDWRTVVLKENPGETELVYGLYSNEPGRGASGWVRTGTQTSAAANAARLPLNTWTHLAATYDGTNVRLYQNGALVATAPRTGTMVNTAAPLTIGGNAVWGEWFAGSIDEVRVYNRALSAAEITADSTRAVTGAPAGGDTVAPSAPGTLSATGGRGGVTLSWGAASDNVGVTRYAVHRSTTAGFTPAAGNRIAQPTALSHTDTVAPGTYYYRVVAEDGAGNLSPASNEATGTSTADTVAPTVALTSPAAGSTVSGSVALSATAADDVAVAGVRFRIDGADLGAEDTAAPYAATWDSRSVANGAHTVAAVARDGAGNTTTVSVAVTVTNTAPPVGGPVAAYGFNEGSGTVAGDVSGTGNNGTTSNTSWAAAGKYGSALSFNGTSSSVVVPDSASLDLSTAMTLSAWVRPATATGWQTVLLKENPARADLVYGIYGNTPTAGPGVWAVPGAGSTFAAESATRLPVNTWTHVAATYDGTNLRLYRNGVLAATRAMTGTMANSTGALRIGGNSIWGEWFNGSIDEVRVYNRVLTAAQITTDSTTPL